MDVNNKILLLRYSDFHGVDTIQEHIKVATEKGHCWWAKIGKQPSMGYIKEIMSQDEKFCLLYTPGMLHLCCLEGVLDHRPDENYPVYYERDIFGKDIEPSVYFLLSQIEEIDLSFLDDYIVCSSEKEVMYTLKKTISSYMVIQHISAPRKPKPAPRVKKEKPKEPSKKVDFNGCVYRMDGMCTNKRCINYKYECTRPSNCLKQKVR